MNDSKRAQSKRIMQASKQYVDDQLQTMAKFGLSSRLSKKEYEALVIKVAKATAK